MSSRREFAKTLALWGIVPMMGIARAGDPERTLDLERLRLCSDFVNAAYDPADTYHYAGWTTAYGAGRKISGIGMAELMWPTSS